MGLFLLPARYLLIRASGLKTSMENVRDGLQQIASGSISGAYNGLITLGKGAKEVDGKLGEAFGKVSETLEDVPVVGWIVSIIDLFKDGLSVVIGGLLDAVFNAVSGILDDVLSGDLFVTIGKSLLSGVGKIFDALTWGGFSSWTTSSNAKEVQETIDRLTERNETLQTAIEDLTEEITSGRPHLGQTGSSVSVISISSPVRKQWSRSFISSAYLRN